MNKFLKNLSKIEFVITNACTGACKHCSQGEHEGRGQHIEPNTASDAVRKIASIYPIKTVMTFGGEPLLYPDCVCEIMSAARDMNIEKRQVITNGFFSNDSLVIREVAKKLASSGVNDLLLSVDAFHMETIPLEIVKKFYEEAKNHKIPLRLQPAWLVSPDHDNRYNIKTRKLLKSFGDDTAVGDGNVIFPEGNALKYLKEYFTENPPENPYVEDPFDVRCVSFCPNGDVLDGNVYQNDILEILESYKA